MVSKCNRIASLVILNYKLSWGRSPKPPLPEGVSLPLVVSPHLCLRHSVKNEGVQWPYRFQKADDGPVKQEKEERQQTYPIIQRSKRQSQCVPTDDRIPLIMQWHFRLYLYCCLSVCLRSKLITLTWSDFTKLV